MEKRYFGTDGIRGPVGPAPMSADVIVRLGWAAGRVLCGGQRGRVVIGRDTRVSGDMLESALEAGLVSAGAEVDLLGVLPTPGIAYLTRALGARAGIVISASHNPFQDNGIKFFGPDGRKLDDETELAIEQALDEVFESVPAARLGMARRVEDAPGRYIEFCKNAAPAGVRLDGLRIVVDSANGAAHRVAPAVFRELGADVISIGADPDGYNINEGVGSTSPEAMQAAVREHGAHLGIALDGDADRVIMADEQGKLRDGDELLYVIAQGRKQAGKLRGPVVGTVMTNLGIEQAIQSAGMQFERASVGDRYVLELLDRSGGLIGGESSGHIICLDRSTTGDGIVAALQVLTEMVLSETSLAGLCRSLSKFPQRLVNVRVQEKKTALESAVLRKAIKAAEAELGADGRVLIRASGTESLIRVMVEGRDESLVRRTVQALAQAVEEGAGERSESA
ncbi:phosphoglucosamine mutase [Natronospira bacteriovora]|uniref:Phosphoglucosamine mutase n=1 Tax=Natronospira bacteriovora TaxID=3069753 RepID=A0ABU0W557_9GAMM|nr:phosphoglucosamine mutase [Natronospira sp. AB-CW4]MDQ2069126.1 phosphoglucosamine mutase [Natronospira sp. AB-CW4]